MPSKVVLPQPLQRASYFFFIVGEALFPLFMQMKIESFKTYPVLIPKNTNPKIAYLEQLVTCCYFRSYTFWV